MTAHLLIEELDRNATGEADAARRQARGEAAQIEEDARADAERRAADARSGRERDAVRAASVAHAEALVEARRQLLPARAVALDRVFASASECIEARAVHPGAGAALNLLVRDALRYVPDGAVRVRCAPALVSAVQQAAALADRSDALVVADPGVPFGAVIESADGAVSVDATFARRLARERAELATEVGRKLVEGLP